MGVLARLVAMAGAAAVAALIVIWAGSPDYCDGQYRAQVVGNAFDMCQVMDWGTPGELNCSQLAEEVGVWLNEQCGPIEGGGVPSAAIRILPPASASVALATAVLLVLFVGRLVYARRRGGLVSPTTLRMDPISMLLAGLLLVGMLLYAEALSRYSAVAQSEQEIRQFLRDQHCASNPAPIVDGFFLSCDPYDHDTLLNYGYDFGVEDAMMNMIDFSQIPQ